MAGDWLKLEAATPDKGEVLAIAALMGWTDADIAVGKLFRVWRWFDQQTVDGNARGVTPALLDRVAGVTGFAEAMQSVGWLCITADGITLPNFDRHNGKTAKARALTSKRVKDFRTGNANSNAGVTQTPLPREEKRREEKNQKTSSSVKKTGAVAVEGFVLETKHREWAAKNVPNVPVDKELAAWRDRMRANGYRAGRNLVRDAQASFYTSCRNAEEWGTYRKSLVRQEGRPALVPQIGAGPVAAFDLEESDFIAEPNPWTEVRDALGIKISSRLVCIEPNLWTVGVDSQRDKDEIRETFGAQIRRRLPANVQVHLVAVRQWLKERKSA